MACRGLHGGCEGADIGDVCHCCHEWESKTPHPEGEGHLRLGVVPVLGGLRAGGADLQDCPGGGGNIHIEEEGCVAHDCGSYGTEEVAATWYTTEAEEDHGLLGG
jgi:hypothetical protein